VRALRAEMNVRLPGGGGHPASKENILDRPLERRRTEINLSAFAFLFSEVVQYCRDRAATIPDLERKLEHMGHRVGEATNCPLDCAWCTTMW
jgi:hypothetical protein